MQHDGGSVELPRTQKQMTFQTKSRSRTITTQSQPIRTARHGAVHTTDITEEQQPCTATAEHAKN